VEILKPNTLVFYSLVVCLFLSSCGNGRPANSTPIAGSVAAPMTPVNVEKKEVFTPPITLTPTCDLRKKLPLVDAILTPEDMIKKYPIFEIGNRWTESTDLTNELLNHDNCSLDCAKRLWSPTAASIILIESNKLEDASALVDKTRKLFTNILEITDRPYISDIAGNAWVAYDYSQQEFVLLYSYNSIFVHITNRPAVGFDDFAGEFDLTYALGKTQNEKLCSSGYEP
jgi:hypothetical protein